MVARGACRCGNGSVEPCWHYLLVAIRGATEVQNHRVERYDSETDLNRYLAVLPKDPRSRSYLVEHPECPEGISSRFSEDPDYWAEGEDSLPGIHAGHALCAAVWLGCAQPS